MTGDDDAEMLARVASELVQRVRDDDPLANQRWLTAALPEPSDWFRLCFALAIAVPDDRPWSHLTAWARVVDVSELVAERYGLGREAA